MGRLARYRPGFNAHREAGSLSFPLRRRHFSLACSSSLQPLSPPSTLPRSTISLGPSFRRHLLHPISLAEQSYSSVCPCPGPCSSLSLSFFVGTRQSTSSAGRKERRRESASEKRGQLADGHGVEEIDLDRMYVREVRS